MRGWDDGSIERETVGYRDLWHRSHDNPWCCPAHYSPDYWPHDIIFPDLYHQPRVHEDKEKRFVIEVAN